MKLSDKKKLLGRIHSLSDIPDANEKKKHYKILIKMIKVDTKKYTINRYGYWIDLNVLSEDTLEEISSYLNTVHSI